MKVTHLLFWVQENKVSEKFYKKLGFAAAESGDTYSAVELGGFKIILVSMRDEDEFAGDSMAAGKGKGIYVYLRVDDIDRKYYELIKSGFKPATKPRNWAWGNREFIVKDPDGYKLCFWQSLDEHASV